MVVVPAVVPAVKRPESLIVPIDVLLLVQVNGAPIPPDAVKLCVAPLAMVGSNGNTLMTALMITEAVPVLPTVSVAVMVAVPATPSVVKIPDETPMDPKEMISTIHV